MTAAIDAGRALCTLILLCLGLAVSAAPALGDTPEPVITHPLAGSWTMLPSPTFSGTSNDEFDPLTVRIYPGDAVAGSAVQTLQTLLGPLGGTWSLPAAGELEPGTYTAVAEQTSLESGDGQSAPVTFTIDTVAPDVTLAAPAALLATSTPTLHGGAGAAAGDLPTVSLVVHRGSSLSGTVAEETMIEAQGEAWSTQLAALPDGIYTAQVSQSDLAGNVGTSESATFKIDTTAPAPAISSPSYGSVLSVSRPAFSGTAGDAAGDQPSVMVDIYSVGQGRSETLVEALGPVAVRDGLWSTSELGRELADGIYTAVVRQSDQAGNSGAGEPLLFVVESRPPAASAPVTALPATQSALPVAPSPSVAAIQWLQPFPVVRIAGAETVAGARISLLSVTAPVGARVTVSCRGNGCPVRSEGVLAGAGHPTASGTQVITFRRFQRALRAGVTLDIRISRAGQIGKFVRFVIRRGKLPTRQDSCLDPATARPIACPHS